MTRTEYQEALSTLRAAVARNQAAYNEAYRIARREGQDARREFLAAVEWAMTVAQIGRVTINAGIAGNSRVDHVRFTFKVDGKRATRAAVEAMIA